METIPKEIWEIIIQFIVMNEDKCRMLMTCKDMTKCQFYFVETVCVNGDIKILKSQWYDYFTKVFCSNTNIALPKYTKHLTFCDFFNQSINNCIPSSIKYLTFGSTFNQSIENCFPTSITHLTFGFCFNHLIKNNIPTSVTHLIFEDEFNQSLMDIPSSVTHLKLLNYNFRGNDLPSFVKEIEFIYDRWGDIRKGQEEAIYECANRHDIQVIVRKDY